MPKKKIFFKNSAGNRLAAWLHIPENILEKKGKLPVLIRVHGYGGSKDGVTSLRLSEFFSDVIFFRMDMHGHGESEGSFDDIDAAQCVDDVRCAVDYVSSLSAVDENNIALTGSSLGGLAVILAAAWHDKVKVAVPVCPVSDLEPLRKTDIKYKKLAYQLGQNNIYMEAEKLNIPVFVIHGSEDAIVPVSHSIELARHLKKGKLHIIPGANHTFDKEEHFNQMIIQIGSFVHWVFK